MTDDDARAWLFGPDASSQLPTRQGVLDAVKDADDTRPPSGIDRQAWGRMSPHDRMQIARFSALLRAVRGDRAEVAR